jgi:hypothetical protein
MTGRQAILTSWLIPAGLAILAAIILFLAPDEATLGSGINSVYLHVSLIWAGMAVLIAAGLLGLIAAITNRPGWRRWARSAGWIGLAFFAAGFGMSVIAAIDNWGGVFWQEPRNATALNVIAITLIVQVVSILLVATRWLPLIHLIPAGILVYGTVITPLVLHPPNAAATSPPAIQATFLGLFFLALLFAGWLLARLNLKPAKASAG